MTQMQQTLKERIMALDGKSLTEISNRRIWRRNKKALINSGAVSFIISGKRKIVKINEEILDKLIEQGEIK